MYQDPNCTSSEAIFLDFYVTLASIGLTTTSQFRIASATSSSPSSALNGSASDISGVDDNLFPDNDNAFTQIVEANPVADISVNKTLDTSGPYTTGQSLTFTIEVSNAGPNAASNILISDTPTNLTIQSVSGAGCSSFPCSINNLLVGNSVTLTVTASIDAEGNFDNIADVIANEADSNFSNNTDNTGNSGVASTVFIQVNDGHWNTASNWSQGQVPTQNDDAFIDSNVQTIIDQNSEVGNLTLIEGTTEETSVTISNTVTLNVKGDLTNNGNFEGDGFVVFDGTSAQTIIGNGTDAGTFSNILLNNSNGLTISDDIDITDVFNIDLGDVTVEAGNFITFKSNATKTAIVDDSNGGNILGCVIVERFIPQKRAFRYMSSPVTTGSSAGCNVKPSINANLQEGEQVTKTEDYPTASANAIQGFGTHITGSQFTADPSSGLDATNTGNPSMFLYDNVVASFNPVLDTRNQGLTAGQDFLLMVRGDRTLDLNVNNTQTGPDTTLRFTGELFTNSYVFTVNSGNANDLNPNASAANPLPNPVFNSLGNPYHANINLGELLQNHSTDILKTRAYVYDPHASGEFGAWITLTFNGAGGISSSTPSNLGKGGSHNGFLQANQAFFVENIDSVNPITPQVTFSESLKGNTNDQVPIFSTEQSNDFSVAIDLYEAGEDDLRDGILISLSNQYDDSYTQEEEALKFFNYLENLAIYNFNSYYSIEKRNLDNGQTEIVQLYSGNYNATDYIFKININNPDNKTVYLFDNYLGTQTLLDVPYYEYNFIVDESVPASVATDRFQLIFDNTTLSNYRFEMAGVEVYPNPVENILNIEKGQFSGQINTISIYDITGKKVIDINDLEQENELWVDMSSLSKGLYILKLNTSNGQFQKKLVKE